MKKIALVTGGNSGIGFATARLLRDKGYGVTISGRNPERVQRAADALGVRGVVADMADIDELEKLAAHFLESGLDALVNNAAIARFTFLAEQKLCDYDDFFATNLRGPMELIRLLLPALERRQGAITNVSSIAVNIGVPRTSLYAATKGGLDAFTRSMVRELAPRGIRINTVAPGAIDTPLFDKLGFTNEELAQARARQEAAIPLGRWGTPEEVAHVIVAQLEAEYVTGATWVVDGGRSAC